MTTLNEPAVSAQQLSAQILATIFGEAAQNFDMTQGTVIGNTDVRVIYLSTDIIHAIYNTLTYEAGSAWALILKNCGLVWGKRVCASLEKELQAVGHQSLGGLCVDSYIDLLEVYFANHGWGKMRFSLDDAQSHGVVRASLTNSLFAHTLAEVFEPVDYMIAGMLQSIFSEISGQDLQCLQISYGYAGKSTSEFIISGAARISALEQLKIQDMSPNEALDRLKITQ